MNSGSRKLRIAVASIVAAVSVTVVPLARADQPTRVELKPRVTLTETQRARLQAVADQGVDALRRYCERTRAIYGWRISDLA